MLCRIIPPNYIPINIINIDQFFGQQYGLKPFSLRLKEMVSVAQDSAPDPQIDLSELNRPKYLAFLKHCLLNLVKVPK